MGLLDALSDPEYWSSVKATAPKSLGLLSQGFATGILGAPVDIVNMAFKPFGLGSDRPIGGSNSIAGLLNAQVDSPAYQIGNMLPIDPSHIAAGTAKFVIPMASALGAMAIGSKASEGAKLDTLAQSLKSQRGIMAGVNAKNADLTSLAKAEELAKDGVPYPDIHKQTGWLLDTPDKMPRFEISDDAVRLKGIKQTADIADYDAISNRKHGVNYGRLPFGDNGIGDVRQAIVDEAKANIPANAGHVVGQVEHAPLYAAYKDVGEIPLFLGNKEGRGNASFSSSGISLDSASDKSALLHELQHAIQEREGFARGGSPEQMQAIINATKSGLLDDLLAIDISKAINEIKNDKLYSGLLHTYTPSELSDVAVARILQKKGHQVSANEINTLRNTLPLLNYSDGGNAYRHLAGEAEARLTQHRMNLTPEQRLAHYPYDPAYFEQATGVPINSLIDRKSTRLNSSHVSESRMPSSA